MSATIKVNTETLTNDQVAQLVAILSQAAATAYDNSEKLSDRDAAANWAGDYMEHHTASSAAFGELLARVGIEEAVEICDTFGAVPEFC